MDFPGISIADITEVFLLWLTKKTSEDAAQTSLDGLGDKPDLPQYVDADADYNDIVAERAEWESDLIDFTEARNSNRVQRLAYESDLISSYLPPNTWVRVDADISGATDYYWIGYNTNTAPDYVKHLRALNQDGEPATPLTENMDA